MAARRMTEGDAMVGDLESRIMAAFAEGATSDAVATVLAEAKEAASAAGDAAEKARTWALDRSLSAPDLPVARREMQDAAFTRDRLQAAAKRLGERLQELRAQEDGHRRQLAYD